LKEFVSKIDSCTIWENPDNYEHGTYDQSGVVIRKRYGSLARMDQNGAVTVVGEEYHAKEMFKGRLISEVHHGEVLISDLKAVGITEKNGTRLLELGSRQSGVSWYMSMPEVKANQYHLSRDYEDPGIVECWLSRRKPGDHAMNELFSSYSENSIHGAQVRSVAKTCRRVTKMIPMYRIAERLGQSNEPTLVLEDYDDLVLRVAGDYNVTELEPEDGFSDFFKDTEVDDIIEGMFGLEAFSVEHQLTAWELNPCLQHITRILGSLRELPKGVLTGSRASEFLSWFDSMEL
jgi:hypothetical protein